VDSTALDILEGRAKAPSLRAEYATLQVDPDAPESLQRCVRILDLRLGGSTVTEIATILDLHPRVVYGVMSTAEYKQVAANAVEAVSAAVKERFVLRAEAHAQNIDDLAFRADKSSVRLAASKDILDRAAATNAVTKGGDGERVAVHISIGDIKLIAETTQQLGAGRAPRILEAAIEGEPVFHHPRVVGEEQALPELAQGSGGLRSVDEGANLQ
jgi:hypothetical protein